MECFRGFVQSLYADDNSLIFGLVVGIQFELSNALMYEAVWTKDTKDTVAPWFKFR
jgi:hypothetical protein